MESITFANLVGYRSPSGGEATMNPALQVLEKKALQRLKKNKTSTNSDVRERALPFVQCMTNENC